MYKVKVNKHTFEVVLNNDLVEVDGLPLAWDISKINDRSFHIIKNNKSYRIEIEKTDPSKKSLSLKINGNTYHIELKDKLDLLLEKLGMDIQASSLITEIKAPMPGLIFDIHVSDGDEVKKGDPIMILEAMKMENVIKAEGDGVVKSVKVKKGDSVEKNQVLIQF
ncbi:MAG: acetyl-CoA carboxylase biotin carboxyl carrier protein subunit [Fulvivirga sp.]